MADREMTAADLGIPSPRVLGSRAFIASMASLEETNRAGLAAKAQQRPAHEDAATGYFATYSPTYRKEHPNPE